MNIDYRKVFLALVAAIIISVPTAAAFQNHNKQIESERQNNSRLQLDIRRKILNLTKSRFNQKNRRKKTTPKSKS